MRGLRSRIFYGWVVVAVAALVILLGAGTRAAPGALLLGMEADTGWSRGDIALAGAAGLLLLGLGGPLSGLLIDRLGIRRLTALAIGLAAGGMLLSAAVTELWQLVLVFGVLTGLGAGLVASSLGPVIANRWFETRRGFVVGLMGASTSAGQLVFFPLLTAIAVAADWRLAVITLGVLLAAVVGPAILLLRERPADVGLRALGAAADLPPTPIHAERGILRRAVRAPEFWLLAGTFFVCGATSNGVVGQHFIAHAVDHGFTAVAASGALALMGAFNFVGTIASGWLTDRFDPRRLLLVYYVFRGLSLLYLPAIHDTLDVVAFSVLFGLDYIATVPPTVMLVADTFGRRNVGVVYGWVFAAHMLGAAIAAWAAGVVRDGAGDYALAFIAAGWMAIAAGVVALLIRRTTAARLVPIPAD
ncbi:MAG TPA: MFS transporter [Candidatus Limnocylindrales bacterium]|nr:MFS transporter [Candidatus Limnocylindrales bacterium]